MIYAVILTGFFILAYNYKPIYKNSFWYACVTLATIILGLHNGHFHSDYPEYLLFFKGKNSIYGVMDSGTYTLEWPYFYMCKILCFFGKNDFTYIFGTYIIYFIPIFCVIKKYSQCIPLSFLLLFIINRTDLHLFLNTAHRQMVGNTFFMLAILYYAYIIKEMRYIIKIRNLLSVVALLLLAVVSHSSSYFILPLLLFACFITIYSKRLFEILLFCSLIIGIFFNKLTYLIMVSIMSMLGDFEEVDRTTFYLINEVYDTGIANIQAMLPLTALTFCFVHFSNRNEINSLFTKCMVIATMILNIFYTVPLINRSMTTLFVLGVAGCIPASITNNRRAKKWIFLIVALHLLIAFWQYSKPEYRLLPFEFIWE